ncbi:MAG: hypothetical protein ABI068_05505 [Ktedonobacterales bacterium]
MRESMRKWFGAVADSRGNGWDGWNRRDGWQWLRLSHPLSAGAQSTVKLLLVAGGVGSFLVGYGLHNSLLFPPTLTRPPVVQSARNTTPSAASGLGSSMITTLNTQNTQRRAPQASHTHTLAIHAPTPAPRHTPAGNGHGNGHGNGQSKAAGKDHGKGEGSGHGSQGEGHGKGHGGKGHGGKGHGGKGQSGKPHAAHGAAAHGKGKHAGKGPGKGPGKGHGKHS